MSKKWVVVGGGGNGITVRSGKDTSSSEEPEKLGTGAVVQEEEISGNRMKYSIVSGNGPKAGWVSVSAGGKDLLVPVNAAEGGQAADALTKVVSGDFSADDAMAIYKSISNKSDKAAGALLAVIPELFIEDQNPSAAVAAGEEAVQLFKSKGDKVGLAAAYTSLANAYFAQELHDKAADSAKQAQAIFRELGDVEGEAAAAETSIRILLAARRSGDAVLAATDTVNLMRKTKDAKSLASALMVRSELLLQSGRCSAAAADASEAQDLFATCGDKREQARAYLAVAYAEMNKECGQAAASAEAAAGIYASLGDRDAQAGAVYTQSSAHLAQIALKQRTCIVPDKADTAAALNASKEAAQLFAQVGNSSGQELAQQAYDTVIAVNYDPTGPPIDMSTSTDDLVKTFGSVKYSFPNKREKKGSMFNQTQFSWRDATDGYHYTLLWEHGVEGVGQNKNNAYKPIMSSKAHRSAAMPMYHSLKATFNGSPGASQGPILVHMNAMNSGWEIGTSLINNVAIISTCVTCKIKSLLFLQINEYPINSVEEKTKARQVYLSPIALSLIRSCRLEVPGLLVGYLALDMQSWNNNRAEVMATIPDVMQSQESEIYYFKGTPLIPTLIYKKMDPPVMRNTTFTEPRKLG